MATSPILGLPVDGPLHSVDWNRPAGNTEMKVTQDAASHAAQVDPVTGKHRPEALDIGDGNPDLDTLYAPHAGTVAQALTVGSANLSIDFDHDGVKWRIVMAHNTLPHPVKVGQVLALGDVVGRMGHTSIPSMPVATHLHIQVGWWNGSAFVWVDPWPLFAQNILGEPVLQGTNPVHIVNKKTTTIGSGTAFRPNPSTTEPPLPLIRYPAGTLFYPDYYVQGGAALGSNGWYGGWGTTPKGIEFGYIHEKVLTTLVPAEQTDCSAETNPLKAEIASLQGRIVGIKTKVATNAADVAND